MRKTEWTTPKLEVLSTRKTAAGGNDVADVFHTGGTSTASEPSGEAGPTVS